MCYIIYMNEVYKNIFDWSNVKFKISSKENVPNIKEREIWWSNLGYNVGHEENGKSEVYKRSVLILKKFTRRLVLVVPLSTKIKDNLYYLKVKVGEEYQSAMMLQIMILDTARLIDPISKMPTEEHRKVMNYFKDILDDKIVWAEKKLTK